jgi:hypothetical protein
MSILEDILSKYPRTKKFLEKTGMTLDQALIFTEIELKKLEEKLDIK